ncbi:MAG: hypothetical protein JNM56_25195, partial [Planctomycetia bacterium]|nr:hypothetical protein [Planctomycetia bacterium]
MTHTDETTEADQDSLERRRQKQEMAERSVLYEKFRKRLLPIAKRLLRRGNYPHSEFQPLELAWDATERLLNAQKNGTRLEELENSDSYFTATMESMLFDEYRKQHSKKCQVVQLSPDGKVEKQSDESPEDKLVVVESAIQLWSLLGERERPIAVADSNGMGTEEIAQALGITARAVRKHRENIEELKTLIKSGDLPPNCIPRDPPGQMLIDHHEENLLRQPMAASALDLARGDDVVPGIRLLRRIGGSPRTEVWDASVHGQLLALKITLDTPEERYCEAEMLGGTDRFHPCFLRGCCLGSTSKY